MAIGYIGDHDLKLIACRLFTELKDKARSGTYVRFDPQSIEIFSRYDVRFKSEPIETDLRGALKELGSTLYHLATGKSVLKNTVTIADTDRLDPMQSELWPVIEILLTGESFNLPDIEQRLALKTYGEEAWEKLAPVRQALKSKVRLVLVAIAGWFVAGANLLRRALNFLWQTLEFRLLDACCVTAIVLSIAYVGYNWHFFSGPRIIFTVVVFWVLMGLSLEFAGENVRDNWKKNESRRERAKYAAIGASLTIIWILMLGMFQIRVPFHSGEDFSNGVSNNPIVVERASGKFVGCLTEKNEVTPLTYRGRWLNPFKVKVIEGLPIEESLNLDLVDNMKLSVTYRLSSRDKYLAALKEWPNRSSLAEGLNTEISKLIPAMNDKIKAAQQANMINNIESCQLKIDWAGELDDEFKKKIEGKLQLEFNILLITYSSTQAAMMFENAITPLGDEIKDQLTANLGEYFDAIEVKIVAVPKSEPTAQSSIVVR